MKIVSATLSGSLQGTDGICITPVIARAEDADMAECPCSSGGPTAVCCALSKRVPIDYDAPSDQSACECCQGGRIIIDGEDAGACDPGCDSDAHCCAGCLTDPEMNPDEGFSMSATLYLIGPGDIDAEFTEVGFWLVLFPYVQSVCFAAGWNDFGNSYPANTEDFINGMAFFLGVEAPIKGSTRDFSWNDSDMYNNTGSGLENISYAATVLFGGPCCPSWPWYSSFEATFTWSGTAYIPYISGPDTLFHAVGISGSTITVSDPGLTGEASGYSTMPNQCETDSFFADCGLGCEDPANSGPGPWSLAIFSVHSRVCFTDEFAQGWSAGFAGWDFDIDLGSFAIDLGPDPYGTHSGTMQVKYGSNDAGVDDADFPGRPTINWSMTVVAP